MATAKKAAGPATKALVVTHKDTGSFWRGGHEFTREPRSIPLADLAPEQADEIRAEGEKPGGWLVVTEIDIEAPKT